MDKPKDFAATSGNLRFAASMAAFGMLLCDSRYKGSATYGNAELLDKAKSLPPAGKYRQ